MARQLKLRVAFLITGRPGRSAGPGDLSAPATLVLPTGNSLPVFVKSMAPSLSDVADSVLRNLRVFSMRKRTFVAPGKKLRCVGVKSEDVLIFTDENDASVIELYAKHMGWDKLVTSVGNLNWVAALLALIESLPGGKVLVALFKPKGPGSNK